MKGSVTVDDFLIYEEEARRVARLRAPAREVRRFHAAVRRFATAWCTKPTRRTTLLDSKKGVALQFETEDHYGWFAVFNLCALYTDGEFCLKGPNPDRGRVKVSVRLKKALDSTNKAWRLLPGAEAAGEAAVTVHLPKLADSGFDRFLEIALDACQEF